MSGYANVHHPSWSARRPLYYLPQRRVLPPRLAGNGGNGGAVRWIRVLRPRMMPPRIAGVAGYFEKKKCDTCKSDSECGSGLTCSALSTDPNKFMCLPRKTNCGLTRRCYGRDSCPCSGNPFKTCQCIGPETTTCPAN